MKRFILPFCVLTACSDITPTPPVSLDGPTAMTVARGRVCLDLQSDGDTRIPIFSECAEGRLGAIGLVVNEQSDRLTFVALDRTEPQLVDLQQGVPGVTHLTVGRLPVDVAASSDGTVAYTLNQIDQDISIVNLWKPEVDSQRIPVAGTAIALESRPGTNEIVVASGSPSVLLRRGGATCEPTGCTLSADGGVGLTLPGTVTDFVITPDGASAYVAYRDLDVVSVVDLASMSVTDTIGATSSCSDGLDNDGDGRADALDPQCFGPFSAEAPEFAGTTVTSGCQDGLDNDEDGLVDRDDPDCINDQATEISAVISDVPLSTCNDGFDNDGDGLTDYPGDPNCYGPYGQTEQAIEPSGFDAIDIDELGRLVYLVDRARNQVVVIDATRRKVIDTAASSVPPTSQFANTIGIQVLPTPLDISATVRRDCMTENNVAVPCSTAFFEGSDGLSPYPYDQVIVRYAYGAWVSEDTGRLRYIEAMDSFCSLPTSEARKLLNSEFVEPGALDNLLEAKCGLIPEFPLTERADFAGDCEVPCDGCDETLLTSRFFCNDGQGVIVNPKFSLVDVLASEGRTGGKSQCEIPAEVDSQLRNLGNLPNAPRNFRCTSQLLPQPISPQAEGLDPDQFPSLDAYQRAELITTQQAYFGWSEGVLRSLDFVRVADERLVAESWTVAYEGELPNTRRSDGLLAPQTQELDGQTVVEFDASPLNLCDAGVQEGDVLTILESPDNAQECEEFAGDIGFLTYEVVSMTASKMILAPTAEEGLAATVPTRSCFPRGLNYVVRPKGQWVVTGERSGLLSERESIFGQCVDRVVPEGEPARRSRVKTGETFAGPYFEFYLWPGPNERNDAGIVPDSPAVEPVRGLSFTFSVVPNFLSRSFSTEGIFPARVFSYQRGAFYRVMSTDPNSNFLFYKDGRSSSEFGTRLR
ncbi:MAG: hypothetical protein R3E66_02765 [bacterium]